jgi:hypothetical protein
MFHSDEAVPAASIEAFANRARDWFARETAEVE